MTASFLECGRVDDDQAAAATELNQLGDDVASSVGATTIDFSSAIGAGYAWDGATHAIVWSSSDAAAVELGVETCSGIDTVDKLEALIAPEHLEHRRAAFVTNGNPAPGDAIAYRLQFRVHPRGLDARSVVWIEEQGRWWADADGRLARAEGVIRRVSEAFREEQQQLYTGDYDALTGQLSRVRLVEALGTVIERAREPGTPCAFLVASVDNIALINEAFGHEAGDQMLRSAGQVIAQQVRSDGTIGRFAANKFGIILTACDRRAMQTAAERLIRAVCSAGQGAAIASIAPTLSVGGVMIPDGARCVEEALHRAQSALEVARSRSHDCFVAFEADPARQSEHNRNLVFAKDVIAALDDNRMRLMLQPVVHATTGKPVFYEALMRLERRDGSLVTAGAFMPMAERLGLCRLLDVRSLELSVDLLRADPGLRLSLNVSGLTCGDHDWLARLTELMRDDRSLAERLIIEITETAAIRDFDQSILFADTIKDLGCSVAIDDFGAGYSSFKTLKYLAVDMIKIDGAFVKNLASEPRDRVFLKAMVDLADSFGMETVAEWVVSAEAAQVAAEVGITYLQGYHFGCPLEPTEVVGKINDVQARG